MVTTFARTKLVKLGMFAETGEERRAETVMIMGVRNCKCEMLRLEV